MRLLIADHQASQRLVLRRLAESAGFQVDVVQELAAAPRPASEYSAALVDARNWDAELAATLHLVLTGNAPAEFSGTRLDPGADAETLRRAVAARPSGADSGEAGESADIPSDPGFLTREPACLAMLDELDRLAPREVSVLIQGESGTGKELVARALHERSPRHGEAFVAINCSAIPSELLESELFGHERGAFTDAHRRHEGCFERAGRGTLFLDEIGDLPIEMQPKLLRVLEARVLTRVGGEQEIPVQARVVAATHRDLRQSVEAGRFRADLFHRLAVATLRIPPLRERPLDLEWLTRVFLHRLTAEYQQAPRSLSPETWARWKRHRWPGNVRELENLLRRGLLTQPEGPLDLHPEPSASSVDSEWVESLRRSLQGELEQGQSFQEIAHRVRRAVDHALEEVQRDRPESRQKGEQKP